MTEQQIAAIFNEWARRYDANPSAFKTTLDANGKHIKDYGQRCAVYFNQIAEELRTAGGPTA